MRTKIAFIALSAMVLTSCTGGNQQVKPQIDQGKEVKEKITFQIEKIPEKITPKESGDRFAPPPKPIDRKQLDLPDDFLDREFLTNSIGFKDRLDLLVGMVAKLENINGKTIYHVAKDFEKDSAKIFLRTPANPILVEKKYDRKVGAAITYLIASAHVENNTAYQVLISDLQEATVLDNAINMKALYNAYAADSAKDSYYLIRGAVTTSILYKDFVKIDAGVDFNAAAIKVGANYYSQNSNIKQDWKIGMQLIKVMEFLKGYVPPTVP